MALVIDATVGGASANSFVLLSEATTYMESRLNGSLWTAATTDNTNRALVEATRELSAMDWLGTRAATTQALAWPRTYATNPDTASFAWDYYASTVIPQRVKDATMELAFQFINAGTTDVAAQDATAGVIEKTVDVLTTRYAEPYARATGIARYPRVLASIRPLLASASGVVTLVRG
jgi:hypothetical protein